jgi:hypothetical protein
VFFILTIYNIRRIKNICKNLVVHRSIHFINNISDSNNSNSYKSEKNSQKNRRNSKNKSFSNSTTLNSLPQTKEVKFFIQMGVILGFTWTIGFFLNAFPLASKTMDNKSVQIFYQILSYLFTILNSSIGIFIFFAFVFKEDIRKLYKNLFFKSTKSSNANSQSIQNKI